MTALALRPTFDIKAEFGCTIDNSHTPVLGKPRTSIITSLPFQVGSGMANITQHISDPIGLHTSVFLEDSQIYSVH